MLFKSSAPGILPKTTNNARGAKTDILNFFLFLKVRMILAGYPSSSSTGDILTLAAPNPIIDVNISVLANPHSPFIKKAVNVATIQRTKIYLPST
jgi:hypothetical protein